MEYFALILFFIFLTLKLAGVGVVATWSWWYVFMPLILLILAYVSLFLLAIIQDSKEEKIKEQVRLTGKSKWALKLEEMQRKKTA